MYYILKYRICVEESHPMRVFLLVPEVTELVGEVDHVLPDVGHPLVLLLHAEIKQVKNSDFFF